MFKLFKEMKQRRAEVLAWEKWTEGEAERLTADLELKRQAAIERMGTKYILHPANHVRKLDVPENSLGFKTA